MILVKQRTLPEPLPDLPTLPLILQKIYASRGVLQTVDIDKNLNSLLSYTLLTDIDKATGRLMDALYQEEKIIIIGDFDADGATSTALAVSALQVMGFKKIDFLVPNRFDFGYGLTPEIVKLARKKDPQLIITVDNGISSLEGVEEANKYNIDVVITDHHLPAEVLPNAYAIVNPNQKGDRFSSKSIAGVGVIFYLMLALRRRLVDEQWFTHQKIAVPNMAQFLDLVALGTIADVVSLDKNNRILVNQGLKRIQKGLCNHGIQALAKISERKLAIMQASDLAFALAPRLNAAGRLEDMTLGIQCLLSNSLAEALILAERLNNLNQERKVIEETMKLQAFAAIKKLASTLESHHHLPLGLCLMDSAWHQGVIGILAGRLKERYFRPVITFALVDNQELKGSARSVSQVNIRDVLANIDKDNPDLIKKFGGHAMAAGLTIDLVNFKRFQQAFINEINRHLTTHQCLGEILSDGPLKPDELTLETAQLLQQAGPWGQHFPEPCFDDIFEVVEQRLIGQKHLKLLLRHPLKNTLLLEGIAFNIDEHLWPNHRALKIHLIYKLDINHYNGKSKLQLIIHALSVVE